ncbi:ABC transporter permease subunit [Serratia marcescens]|nr:ABC transporter permease subunit [Serratia marcescens]
MRFLLGMAWSLLFSVVFAVLAARYTPLRRVILPFVNFMESVPLVGFLTFTTVYFLNLYPHSVMGLECTAIFAVFTGQAWNMMLTLYQTLRIVPKELDEAARSFNYNPWQRFWRLEFIYSVPGLLWNAMVSQSAAWFALVASEAIPVGDRSVELPGVGSYIAEALAQQNVPAILYAIVALAANIVLLDQLVFRPLVRYTARFKYEDVTANRPLGNPWFYNSLAFSHVGAALGHTRARWLTCGCSSCRGCGTPSACTACSGSPPRGTGCGAACGISAWCWPASGSVTGCGNTSPNSTSPCCRNGCCSPPRAWPRPCCSAWRSSRRWGCGSA